jgi:2,4-dienoyl-CoA reductase-like NADH-dependent reductase (Old Yellow Enzyme family)
MKANHLLKPLVVGDLKIPNRIIMAPLTRCRASGLDGRTPNSLMAEYYTQRATAGLILTEATSVSAQGVGYPNTPGIWSNEHVAGWKTVTQSVQRAGGRIFLQLWHVGRISDPFYLDGQLPVAPSSIASTGHVSLMRPKKEFVVPRALETREIPGIVNEFKMAAEKALQAGFDGVEIHGANGYLLDQFLQSTSNHRTDDYGGSVENRARLMLETADAVISVWGANRVGMHLAPRCDSHNMGDSNPLETFSYVARELGKKKIAFICARESLLSPRLGPQLKNEFGGVYISNEGFTLETAESCLAEGEADAVAFGKNFISNADLCKRLAVGAPLNAFHAETFYGGSSAGYTDYPLLDNTV